jgi:hypothetical protein
MAMGSTKIEHQKEEESRRVVCAVELGWRIAYFYADLEHPLHDGEDPAAAPLCLPAVATLSNSDQVELHVRAAASLARRLRLDATAEQIDALAGAAHAAAKHPERRTEVRERTRSTTPS